MVDNQKEEIVVCLECSSEADGLEENMNLRPKVNFDMSMIPLQLDRVMALRTSSFESDATLQ